MESQSSQTPFDSRLAKTTPRKKAVKIPAENGWPSAPTNSITFQTAADKAGEGSFPISQAEASRESEKPRREQSFRRGNEDLTLTWPVTVSLLPTCFEERFLFHPQCHGEVCTAEVSLERRLL